MRILKFELLKLIKTPMFWVFMVLSLSLNIMVIVSESGWNREVNELSREIATSGEYTDSEIGNIYADYNASEIADSIIEAVPLNPTLERLMRDKYDRQQAVADEFAENGESYYIYAGGMTQHIHQLLFGQIMGLIMIEAGLLAALAVMYLIGYEKLNKTEFAVYSSKKGRCVIRNKYAAGLLFGAGGFVTIALSTFAVYFSVWDYSGFWKANVSSANNMFFDPIVGFRPLVTWESMTVAEYFARYLLIAFVLTLILAAFGGVIGLLLRNTYTAFIVFAASFLAMLAVGFVFADIGFYTGVYVATFNPAWLWLLRPHWFADMGMNTLFPWHETRGIIINAVIIMGLTTIIMKRFKRKDMV